MLEKFRICDNLDVCLKQLYDNPKWAVAISSEYVRSSRLFSASNVFCFKKHEIIHSYTLKFLVRKNFTHSNQLNAFIQTTTANGLVKKWRSNNRSRNHSRQPDIVFYPLRVSNAAGMYFIWMILKVLALLSLVLEKHIHRQARRSNPSRFWKLAEMAVDPDRHLMVKHKMN